MGTRGRKSTKPSALLEQERKEREEAFQKREEFKRKLLDKRSYRGFDYDELVAVRKILDAMIKLRKPDVILVLTQRREALDAEIAEIEKL